MLAGHLSAHGQESAGQKRTVLLQFLHVWHELRVPNLEELRIVEQRTVDATAVRTLYMYVFIATCLQRFLCREVVERLAVLHLAQSNHGASHVLRQHVGAHVGKSPRHVLQLVRIFQPIPAVRPRRKEVVVSFALVVASIEEILLVVESHSVAQILFLILRHCADRHHAQR